MDHELYDYRKYDQVWRRVNPQENPYPETRRTAATTPAASGSTMPPMYQTLLREELRHMQQVLQLLENALA